MNRKIKIAIISLLLASLSFSAPVHAYIDPATTTYIIQIVTALIITLGVTIGVFFTRVRLSIVELYVRISEFFIRLFSKKKVKGRENARTQLRKQTVADELTLGKRALSSVCVSVAFAFTFVVFGIYELYKLNADFFNFPLKSLLPSVLLLGAFVAIILCGILVIFRGIVFETAVSLVFGILLAGYVQGNFLNGGLGQLTGDPIDWSARTGSFLLNTLVWVVIISIPFILKTFNRKAWTVTVRAVSSLLVLVQLVSMIVLGSYSTTTPHRSNRYLSAKAIAEVAKNKNIIVFVLDRLDIRYIERVRRDDLHFFDRLDGFTEFTNNVSLYSQTFPSVANMFTGQIHMFERPMNSYLKEAWTTSTFLPELRRQHYAVHLYMEPGYTYADISDLEHITDNIVENEISLRTHEALAQFVRLSAFRYAPLLAKPFYWTSTDQFSRLISEETMEGALPYVSDDIKIYKHLKSEKIRIGDIDRRLTYIHMQGPHMPYVMNEKAEPAAEGESNAMIQTKGSFHIVYEYLDQLKQLGLYESSTIVITGDHGARKNDVLPLEEPIVTALFIKPSGKAGTPLEHNSAPVSTDQFRPFIYSEAGIPYEGLGKTYFEISKDSSDPRYLYHRLIRTTDSPEQLLIYKILGDANQFENWELIEERVIDR